MLEAPPGARPTSARARAALFSILQDVVPGARLRDQFAGSGAIGLEALSRGAARVCLVEEDAGALSRNLARLDPPAESARLIPQAADGAVRLLNRRGERFDVVFADPPYASGPEGALRAGTLLAAGGLLILQRDRLPRGSPGRNTAESEAGARLGLRCVQTRTYGRNVFHVFEPAGGTGAEGSTRAFDP